jgi:hypothetical protein
MPAPRKNMRNTRRRPARKNKRRGARKAPYKPRAKRTTAKMLQPIAEGRKVPFINDSSLIKITGPSSHEGWQVFIPETWNSMYRESFLETLSGAPTSKGFTGNTLFSRYLTQQIRIKFDQVYHIGVPANFHIVWGWSKIPYITPEQAIGATASTNTHNVLIEHDRKEFIANSLAIMYNQMFPTTNRKQFALKYNKQFQVRGESVNTPRLEASQVRKDLTYHLKWAPNTKYHMRPATSGNGNDSAGNPVGADQGTPAFSGPTGPLNTASYWTPSSKNNGDLWVPFFAIQLQNPTMFGKDKDGMSDTNAYPTMYQKNTHYFYDI